MAECFWASFAEVSPPSLYMREPYHRLFAAYDGAEVRLAAISSGGRTSWLPMLVRRVGEGVCEAYSAYGYGGFWGRLCLAEADVAALKTFLAEAGIAALFLRHAPFLSNQNLLPDAASELNRNTYAVELRRHGSLEESLQTYGQMLRRNVRLALRAGLEPGFHSLATCPVERIGDFHALYRALMTAKGASAYYLFPEAFLREHAARFGADCELEELRDPGTGELLAAALFLRDQDGLVHYHLGASSGDARQGRAMDLLFAAAIHRYGNQGFHALHLGGGLRLDESDGLSRFKRKFATQRLAFHCSKLVCDEQAYARERARLPLRHPGLFLTGDARGTPQPERVTA